MSHFVTQNGLVVTCDSPTCTCHTTTKPATAGGLNADDEERWFNELCDAIDEYLNLYAQHRESPKADRAALDARMHEAKTDVITRFYTQGWDKS